MSMILTTLDPVQQELWDGFICYERKRGIKNIATGVRNLVRFIEFLNRRNLRACDVGVQEVWEFEIYLQTVKTEGTHQPLSEGSRKAFTSTAKRFFSYLQSLGRVKENPFTVREKMRADERKKRELACYDMYHLQEFLKQEKQRGLKNPQVYTQRLRKLFSYLEECGCGLEKLEAGAFGKWLATCKRTNGRTYGHVVIDSCYVTAKRYCGFLVKQGWLKANPLAKKTQRLQKALSEYERLEKGFEDYCRLKGRRPATIMVWKNRLKRLYAFLDQRELDFRQVKVLTAQEYQGWVMELGERTVGGYETGTIIGHITAATAFFDYLKYKKIIHTNPFRGIRCLKERRKLPRGVLKENEMNRLLKEFADFDKEKSLKRMKCQYRFHVLAELLYSTGMRIREAAEAKLEDIDFIAGTILLRETKDRKERMVFLNEYCRKILRLYVEELRPVILDAKADRTMLFGCNASGLKCLFNRRLKEVAENAKLPGVTSKSFRHAFGYHFLRAGCDMRYIQAFLGHSQLTSTEKYTKVDKEDLRGIIDKYHPRQWRTRE